MFKVSHTTLITISGCIWLAIGVFLLQLGLNFINQSILLENAADSHPLLNSLAPYLGSLGNAAVAVLVVAFGIGYLKGTRILSKTVQRSVERILALSNPASITQIYAKKYYILLGSMILLGVLARLLPNDIRGFVDVTIGIALVNGAMLYFRLAYASAYGPKMEAVKVRQDNK